MSIVTRLVKLIMVTTLVFLQGCAQMPDQAANQITAPEDKAVIYFYRTGFGGGAIKFHVHDLEGRPAGYLGKNGDNFTIEVDPGTHQYWSRAASRNDVILNVEAGKVYYVKGTVNMGLAVGRPVLEEVFSPDN